MYFLSLSIKSNSRTHCIPAGTVYDVMDSRHSFGTAVEGGVLHVMVLNNNKIKCVCVCVAVSMVNAVRQVAWLRSLAFHALRRASLLNHAIVSFRTAGRRGT